MRVALLTSMLMLGGCSLILSESSGDDAGPQDRDGSINAGDASVENLDCGKMSLLQDDFESNALNRRLWAPTDDVLVTQSGGTLRLAVSPGAVVLALGVIAHDLRESEVSFEVGEFPTMGEFRAELVTGVGETPSSVQLVFLATGAEVMVTVQVTGAGSSTFLIGPVDFDESFWRMSLVDSEFKVESSANGTDFTERTSFNPTIDLSRVSLNFRLGESNSSVVASIESVNSGSSSPAGYCQVSSLTDDFSSPDVLDQWLEPTGNCSLSSGGAFERGVIRTSGNGYCRFLASEGFAFRDGVVSVSLPNLGSTVGGAGLRIFGEPMNDDLELRFLPGQNMLRVETPSSILTHDLPPAADSVSFRLFVRDGAMPMMVLEEITNAVATEVASFPLNMLTEPPLRLELFVDSPAGDGYAEFDDLGMP